MATDEDGAVDASQFSRSEQEACQAAAAHVAEMLSEPEQLQKVSEMKQDIMRSRAALDTQLKGVVQTQLDDAKEAVDLVANAFNRIKAIRTSYETVDALYQECRDLIPHFDILKEISGARRNLHATLRLLDQIQSIPETVEQLKMQLAEDENSPPLLWVHQQIKHLERAKERCLMQAAGSPQEEADLQSKFLELDNLVKEMDGRIWQIVCDCLTICKDNPALIVQVMRIVEREEMLVHKDMDYSNTDDDTLRQMFTEKLANDEKYSGDQKAFCQAWRIKSSIFSAWMKKKESATAPPLSMLQSVRDYCGVKAVKRPGDTFASCFLGKLECGQYGQQLEKDLTRAVHERFESMLRESETMDQLLDTADGFIRDDLTTIFDVVVPCFPPRYDIFTFLAITYHKRLYEALKHSTETEDPVPEEILKLVNWVKGYHSEMEMRFGLTNLEPKLVGAFEHLTDVFVTSVKSNLGKWVENIVKIDIDNWASEEPREPQPDRDGHACTNAPIELMQIMNSQLGLAESASRGKFLFDVVEECCGAMELYCERIGEQFEAIRAKAKAERAKKAPPTDAFVPGYEYVVEQINVCSKMSLKITERKEYVESILEEPYKDNLEHLSNCAKIFFDTAKDGANLMVLFLYADLPSTMETLFHKDKWANPANTDHPVSIICATLADFFAGDFGLARLMDPPFFERMVMEALDFFVHDYVQRLLKSKIHDQHTSQCIARDNAQMEAMVTEFIPAKAKAGQKTKVQQKLEPLHDLAEFLEQSDSSSYELWANDLINHNPDISQEQLKTLLSMKVMEKAVRREVTDKVLDMQKEVVSKIEGGKLPQGVFSRASS